MSAEIVVAAGTEVTLHFSLSLENGESVDSNFDAAPATLVLGDGNMLPGFEQCLLGMKVGEQRSFSVPPEKGFGQANSNNVQTIDRAQFAPGVALEEGLVMAFADAAGGEVPGVVKAIHADVVEVDFNHPLAGRTITFVAHIVAIKPTITH